jgi:hypothetical protein
MRKTWLRVLGGSLVGLAVAAVLAPSVAVADTPSHVALTPLGNGICDSGEFCIYRDRNLSGPVKDYNQGIDDVTYTNNTFPIVGGRVNDEGSSVRNRTTCDVRVFEHSDFNGDGVTVPPGGTRDLHDSPVGGDSASSHNACV